MALAIRKCPFSILATARFIVSRDYRCLSTLPETKEDVSQDVAKKSTGRKMRFQNPALEYRHVYPEFLPDPNPKWRNTLREKMERADMLKRRSQIDIPEFYVGSILAVVISDPHAQGKTNRFVGICIERKGCGLRAEFTLRNVVDHQGVEVECYLPHIDGETADDIYRNIRYELYDPTIQTIQVLRLEKRLDDKLYYLRDALPEYSTFSFDMDSEILPEGTPVPVNPVQVKLKPKPWLERWERQDLKGISNIDEHLKEKDKVRRELRKTPWEKYDLMKQYRQTIPAEDQNEIWGEVHNQLNQLRLSRKKMFKKRPVSAPKSQLA